MAERVFKKKPAPEKKAEPTPAEQKAAQTKGEKLKADIDDILDDIDAILESDAEAFVKGYVQKGGQ